MQPGHTASSCGLTSEYPETSHKKFIHYTTTTRLLPEQSIRAMAGEFFVFHTR